MPKVTETRRIIRRKEEKRREEKKQNKGNAGYLCLVIAPLRDGIKCRSYTVYSACSKVLGSARATKTYSNDPS